MKHFLCLVQICIILAIYEVDAKRGKDILAECVTKKLNAYHDPMKPCFDECAGKFLGGKQNQVQQCFFNKDPSRLYPGVDCVTKDATCYKRRKPRDLIFDERKDLTSSLDRDNEYVDAQTHSRVIRAANTTDVYGHVIAQAVIDLRIISRLEGYRQCKLKCYSSYHSTNNKNLMSKNGGRFRRAVDLEYELAAQSDGDDDDDDDDDDVRGRKRRQAKSKKSPDYFQMFLGHCYRQSNCRSTDGVANKCMPLFFPKKDPVRFCNCIRPFYPNHVDCGRYNNAGGSPAMPSGVANVMGGRFG